VLPAKITVIFMEIVNVVGNACNLCCYVLDTHNANEYELRVIL